jgi:uncharacterized membrane protein YvbJ
MFWLKRCPQCGGDLMDESDVQGSFIGCLQCGRMLTLNEEQALRRESPGTESRRPGSRRAGAA